MFLELTIDRLENGKAVLKTDDNETIIWPKSKLPKDSKEGSILAFSITDNREQTTESKQLAKDILNEILNTDDN